MSVGMETAKPCIDVEEAAQGRDCSIPGRHIKRDAMLRQAIRMAPGAGMENSAYAA